MVVAWGFGSKYMCPSSGCPVPVIQATAPLIGVVLILDALACLVEFRGAFVVGGALSAVVAVVTLYNWAGHYGGEAWATLVVLSILSLIFDLIALRPREQLNEQANPMNLPVFG